MQMPSHSMLKLRHSGHSSEESQIFLSFYIGLWNCVLKRIDLQLGFRTDPVLLVLKRSVRAYAIFRTRCSTELANVHDPAHHDMTPWCDNKEPCRLLQGWIVSVHLRAWVQSKIILIWLCPTNQILLLATILYTWLSIIYQIDTTQNIPKIYEK